MSDAADFDEDKAQQDAEKQQKLLADRYRDDVTHVMSSQQGRRVVWNLLSAAGVFKTSFTGDNNATNFNEGRRSEGLRLFSDVMGFCPDLYMLMAKEAKDDEEKA